MSSFLSIGGIIVEKILLLLIWSVQIGAVLLLAAFLAWIVQLIEEAIRMKKVKFRPRILVVFLLLCVILAGFALRPPVVCSEELEARLEPEWREAVRSVSSGLYSWNVPLVPVCVQITGIEAFAIDGTAEHRVDFDVYYFCFGKLGMEYSTYDGFNTSAPHLPELSQNGGSMKRRGMLIRAAILILLLVVVVFKLLSSGAIVFDHSGERRGEGLYWNGYLYVPAGGDYDEGKTIAKTTDGWLINEVEGDPEHIYVVLRSFLDNYLLVREDHKTR